MLYNYAFSFSIQLCLFFIMAFVLYHFKLFYWATILGYYISDHSIIFSSWCANSPGYCSCSVSLMEFCFPLSFFLSFIHAFIHSYMFCLVRWSFQNCSTPFSSRDLRGSWVLLPILFNFLFGDSCTPEVV